MLRIVLPPVAAPTRQGGHSISAANPANTPNAARSTNPASSTNPARSTYATSTTDPANAAKVAAIPPASDRIRGPVAAIDV
jgi:hypothetical protein